MPDDFEDIKELEERAAREEELERRREKYRGCFRIEASIKEVTDTEILNFASKLPTTNNEDVVIVCIGTDRCIYDSLGPMVGSLLQQRGTKLKVYGTLHDTLHAMNIEKRVPQIIEENKDKLIIAVDAMSTEKDNDLRKVILKEKPISPGSGHNKVLPEVGTWSIGATTNEANALFFGERLRISEVYDLSIAIVKVLEKYYELNEIANKADIA